MPLACTVIAEIACIHEGDRDYLLALARAVRQAGADAVKFQVFSPDDVVAPTHSDYAYFQRISFSAAAWERIIQECAAMGLGVWVDVSGAFSLDVVRRAGSHIAAVKVHAADVDNPVVLEGVKALGMPVGVSCGGSTLIELFECCDALGAKRPVVLFHGFQSFPKLPGAPGGPPARGVRVEEMELWKIPHLARIFPWARIGLSDHLAGEDPMAIQVPAWAVALGATVIEKHVTLRREERREDYYSALEPDELAEMVHALARVQRAVGRDQRRMLEAERGYQREMKRTVVTVKDEPAGRLLEAGDLALVRDGRYAGSTRAVRAIGRQLAHPVPAGSPVTQALLTQRVGVFCNARLASSRLPRKALLPFYDRYTTLGYLLKRLTSYAGTIGQVALATTVLPEDDALEAIARELGVACVRGEPEDVMGRMIQAADTLAWDVLVRVTGDDQFVSCEYIERALQHHLEGSLDYTRVVGLPVGMACEVLDVRTLKRLHRAVTNARQTEYLTWYLDSDWICRHDVLQAAPEHRGEQFRVTLDYQEDYELMRELAARCHAQQQGFYVPLERVLLTLKEMNPSWVHRDTLWPLQREHVDTRLVHAHADG